MDTKERKIHFSVLIKREWTTRDEEAFYSIVDVIKYIKSLNKKDKIYQLKESKACLLQSANVEKDDKGKTIITGFFKSARHTFRPNLINTDTGDERPSPKLLKEGDIEKTHFAIKIDDSEVYFLLENNGNGLSMNQTINYIGFFTRKYIKSVNKKMNFTVVCAKIGKNDFLEAISELKRTRIAEVYFDKSLMGSAGLDYSNRTTSLKRELMLTAKAEKDESITETAIDIFNKFSGGKSGISKVRIYGNDEENNKVVIDTSFIEKIDHLNISINPTTGEITTTEMLTGLKGLLKM